MTDDQPVEDVPSFDSSKKKKKKKKVQVEEEPSSSATQEALEPQPEEEEKAEENPEEVDLSKKKKKKKSSAKKEEEEDDPEAAIAKDLEDKKKKKKKKKEAAAAAAAAAAEEADDQVDAPAVQEEGALPWSGSDRDYTYEELLNRVTETLRERNPDLSGEKKKFLMKPPQVMREGTKKTVFVNFAEICKIMRRNPDHVYQFMMAELGTSGSIDGSQRMVIKGRFQPKAIENILRRYVVEYLTCHSCKSPDTILKKDNRLFFLLCNQCGAQRSVAAIKAGYVAQVGKRKKA